MEQKLKHVETTNDIKRCFDHTYDLEIESQPPNFLLEQLNNSDLIHALAVFSWNIRPWVSRAGLPHHLIRGFIQLSKRHLLLDWAGTVQNGGAPCIKDLQCRDHARNGSHSEMIRKLTTYPRPYFVPVCENCCPKTFPLENHHTLKIEVQLWSCMWHMLQSLHQSGYPEIRHFWPVRLILELSNPMSAPICCPFPSRLKNDQTNPNNNAVLGIEMENTCGPSARYYKIAHHLCPRTNIVDIKVAPWKQKKTRIQPKVARPPPEAFSPLPGTSAKALLQNHCYKMKIGFIIKLLEGDTPPLQNEDCFSYVFLIIRLLEGNTSILQNDDWKWLERVLTCCLPKGNFRCYKMRLGFYMLSPNGQILTEWLRFLRVFQLPKHWQLIKCRWSRWSLGSSGAKPIDPRSSIHHGLLTFRNRVTLDDQTLLLWHDLTWRDKSSSTSKTIFWNNGPMGLWHRKSLSQVCDPSLCVSAHQSTGQKLV